MEEGRYRAMMANEHITVGSSLYEKSESIYIFGLFIDKSKFYSRENKMPT